METSQPFTSLANYVSPSVVIPFEWEDAREILTDQLTRLSYAVNTREISVYQNATLSGGNNISETLNGQVWFRTDNVNLFRYGTRTVVDMGGLQDFGGGVATQSVAHGITTTAKTRFTRVYGCATNPGASTTTLALPIPYVDVVTLANGIQLTVDATNVNLKYGANYSAFTYAYVVLEWVEDV